MEAFVVSEPAVAAAKRKRQSHPPDRIKRAVTLARQLGVVAAASSINKTLAATDHVLPDTLGSWLSRWRKEGDFWEKAGKRGRPSLMSGVAGAHDEWERQINSLRQQGASVTGRVAATAMRAVLEEKAPSLLDNHGGAAKLTPRGAAKWLAAADMSFRKKNEQSYHSTNRIGGWRPQSIL